MLTISTVSPMKLPPNSLLILPFRKLPFLLMKEETENHQNLRNTPFVSQKESQWRKLILLNSRLSLWLVMGNLSWSLADAYLKVLMSPEGLVEKLKKNVVDKTIILERCLHVLDWERSQEQTRKKEEEEVEQERIQMAMIDWHDFVVVETIDFADEEDEDLPSPMIFEEVIRRSKFLAMEVEEKEVVEMEMEIDEEEVELVEKGMRAGEENGESIKLTDVKSEKMRIVKNWKRLEERALVERDATKYVKSPITGELININEMSEHMRISLIDPKYKDQKERMYAKIRETTLAQDDEISKNIVGLARLRPDIFGTTEEEVSNAVKAEIEKKKDEQPKQVIWDGHTGSIGRTATQAMSQNNEDNIDNMNNGLPGPAAPPSPPRPAGLPLPWPLPPPPGILPCVQYSVPPGQLPPRPHVQMMPPGQHLQQPPISFYSGQQHFMMNRPPPISINQFMPLGASWSFPTMPPPPPLQKEARAPLLEEPEPKRQRLEDSVLIPEDQFLAQHPGPVRVSISVPNVDEGNLKRQLLEITVQSLSETVGSLKEKIAGEIQLPSNKQKLSGKAGFLKDNLSLAYYNIAQGEALSLSLRERGGRKR